MGDEGDKAASDKAQFFLYNSRLSIDMPIEKYESLALPSNITMAREP
jgi:hypothetical protein